MKVNPKSTCLFSVIFVLLLSSCLTENSSNSANSISKIKQISNHLKNPSDDTVLVVAHRGAWRYAPENSIEAIERCIELGVDIVEIDVRLTKDGHLVAMHDLTVDRTTNGTGKVSDLTLAQIKALRLRNGCGVKQSRIQIPTLEEIMLLAKGKIMINLDKTEGKTVREAYTILKKTGTVDHAIFKGNDPYKVMRAKYGTLLDSIIYMPKLWYKNSDVKNYLETYEKELNPFAYETLFDSKEAKTFELIPQIKQQGDTFLAIALWDELCAGYTDEKALLEGPNAAWGKLIALGANALMTDRPTELLAYLREKKLHD